MRLFVIIAAALTPLLGSCETVADTTPVAAMLERTDAKILTRLENTISKAMDGKSVNLPTDSLMTQSYIAIDPPSVGRRNGRIIDGRSMERPDHFDLMMAGRKCYLVHRQSGAEYPLKNMPCVAAG